MGLLLGLDLSTQSLKATVLKCESLEVVAEVSINFDQDLSTFQTRDGVHRKPDGVVTSPVMMWVESIDAIFNRLVESGVNLAEVSAISGSGQQHGSVYWKTGAAEILKGLQDKASGSSSLNDILKDAFAIHDSPVWMDSSTTRECKEIESWVGGADRLAQLTGSRGYERFTGPQILKRIKSGSGSWEHISLVSSFVASVLLGCFAGIDVADGSGMNLMDIKSQAWVPEIVKGFEAEGVSLHDLLGEPVASNKALGNISSYFSSKYGVSPNATIVAWSGDNPCSLAGLRLEVGDVAVSLGTSNVLFASLKNPVPSIDGHIFCNPLDPEAHMGLLVYKNGTLLTQEICQLHCGGDWKNFSQKLTKTRPGNDGHIGFYFREIEITPQTIKCGTFRFNALDESEDSFPEDVEIRAAVEFQFMSMRSHAVARGIVPKRVFATGGGSVNVEIMQVLSDVFQVPVFVSDQPSSASLGAAYRAGHGHETSNTPSLPFVAYLQRCPSPFHQVATPTPGSAEVVQSMFQRFQTLENGVVAKLNEQII